MGSGASGYIAILSDVTVLQVPMAIFCIFSLFAGVLVTFLPETRDLPLPDTMWVSMQVFGIRNNGTNKNGAQKWDEQERYTKMGRID
jgi:hypothetical protein